MRPRPFRTPYPRGSVWWARLPVADGSSHEVSLGLRDEVQATRALQALGACFNADFWQRDIVYAVGRGDVSVSEFMVAYQRQELRPLAKRLAHPDPDLNEYVAAWQEWLRASKRTTDGTRAKYLQQLRALIPSGDPFPASRFTRGVLASFLSGLNISAPNRYRAALSKFGRFLVEREVLAFNPVRDVQCAKERAPRMRYLLRDEAQRLIDALTPTEARAFHALMCGSGMEIGAVLALRHRDVELATGRLQAHGTKRLDRDRAVYVTEIWCWDIVKSWIREHPALPAAPVFRMGYYAATAALKQALKAVQMVDYRSHDWRHTYAVQGLKDGRRAEFIGHQLGHKNAAMVHKVYGRYVPDAPTDGVGQTIGLTIASGVRAKPAGRVMAR